MGSVDHRISLREKIHQTIFLNETRAGHRFDIFITTMIVLSMIVVMLESIQEIKDPLRNILNILEWVFTILFTIEYLLRLYSSRDRRKYAFSFFGIVDFLSITPTYLAIMFVGIQHLL